MDIIISSGVPREADLVLVLLVLNTYKNKTKPKDRQIEERKIADIPCTRRKSTSCSCRSSSCTSRETW